MTLKLLTLYCQAALLVMCCTPLAAQLCENRALNFDGIDDFITFNAPSGYPINGSGDFTVEMWLTTATNGSGQCPGSGDHRYLFSLFGGSSYLEAIECQGRIIFNWKTTTSLGFTTTSLSTPLTQNNWSHLTVTKSGNDLNFYLDCQLDQSRPINGNFSFNQFQLGASLQNISAMRWHGFIDEVRIWNTALSASDLCDGLICLPTGKNPNLRLHLQMDQGIPQGNNISIPDLENSANPSIPGVFQNFGLTGASSNFDCAPTSLVYPDYSVLELVLSDPTVTNPVTELCAGEPLHFSLLNGGMPAQAASNVSIIWEQDDGAGWNPVSNPSDFGDYSFLVPAIPLNCANNTVGYVDRKYRATLTVTDGVNTCSYLSGQTNIRVCCPINNLNLAVVPTPSGILNGTLCEGDMVGRKVDLLSTHPWIVPPGPNTSIKWIIDGTYDATLDQMTSFTLPNQIVVPNSPFCVKAEVASCGKTEVVETCFTVDSQPVCDTIRGKPQNLMNPSFDPVTANWTYQICPGDDAVIAVDDSQSPSQVDHCIPHWEYSFDQITWDPNGPWLGVSNQQQNTNTIPWQFFWNAGATEVHFRFRCEPLSTPSGCDACYSNVVTIQIKPVPAPPTIIGPTQVCTGNTGSFSVSNPVAGANYIWYLNGQQIASGPTSLVNGEEGCYWVEQTDDCGNVQTSNQVCTTVCEPIAIISCPLAPNPCASTLPAMGGPDVYLSGSNSLANCSPIVDYQWTANNGTWVSGQNTVDIQHVPDPVVGTTYTLTVTDAFGCTHMSSATVLPCE